MVITRITNASPDMIMTAFDVKIHKNKNVIHPEACRPSNKLNKNNVEKVDPKKVKKTMSIKRVARPPARAGGPGGAAPREKEKEGIYNIYIYRFIQNGDIYENGHN